jgi:hypothetical protein
MPQGLEPKQLLVRNTDKLVEVPAKERSIHSANLHKSCPTTNAQVDLGVVRHYVPSLLISSLSFTSQYSQKEIGHLFVGTSFGTKSPIFAPIIQLLP